VHDQKHIRVVRTGLYASTALREELLAAVPNCQRVQVGIDPERCLIEIRPTDSASGAKANLSGKDSSKGLCIASTALSRWLASFGAPLGVNFPARWQPQTGSIVARYVPARSGKRVDSAKPAEVEDSDIIKACGHQWRLTEYVSPSGSKLYRCVVCGYFTIDPRNPVLNERACKPGIYEGRYRIEDGVVYPAVDASWGGKGRKGKGKAQDVGGGREEVGSCEA